MPKIAIIIPVYNEAENIRLAIEKIEEIVYIPHIISVVYDMDEDSTVPVVREIQRNKKNLALIKNKYGRGVLNAIKTGLETTAEKYAVITMADLSDPPSVINDMYTIAEEHDADIVCASRYMKGGRQTGGPLIKGIMSRMAGVTLRYFAGVPTHDATNSFKLYRISFLLKEKIESTGGFELGIELVAKAHVHGYKIYETPTTWTDRPAGNSHFKLLGWLPNYLNWYFYAFEAQPKETDARIVAIIKKYRGRFIKYAFAGLACAVIDWSMFYILYYRCHTQYLAAAMLACLFLVTTDCFLKKLIFFSCGKAKRTVFLSVLITGIITIFFDLLVTYLLAEQFFIPIMTAKILSIEMAFWINRFLRQFLILKSGI